MFFLENNFNNDLEDHNNINVEYKIASYPLYGKYDGYGRIIFDKHLKFDNLLIFVNKILLNKIK